jgi:hypothetical protein
VALLEAVQLAQTVAAPMEAVQWGQAMLVLVMLEVLLVEV